MSRELRIQCPNVVFHVINRGNAKQQLFHHQWEYKEFLILVKKYKEKFDIKIYNYVLMPNHIHFLLESKVDGAISLFMQGLTLAYACKFNRRKEKTGHVWQGRFKCIPVEKDDYFLQCGQYIELNPVRASIVLNPAQYPWSSYGAHASGVRDPIVDDHPLYTELGNSPGERMLHYKKEIIDAMDQVQM